MTPDFVVIGAGIAGASAAFELAASGNVLLIEREKFAGYHTTGRSAALYTEAWETGVLRALTLASRSFLETPPDDFVDYPILSPLSVMIVGRSDQSELVRALHKDASQQAAVSLISGTEAEDQCPLLRPGYVDTAVFETGSRAIDVDALHQGFLRGVKRRGGTVLLDHGVASIDRRGSEWIVTAGDVEATTPVVVNAAGAWCDVVAAMAGVAPIGLVPKRRTAFTFAAPEGTDLDSIPIVIDVAVQFYFKPEAGQLMGSLAEETPMEPHDVRPEEIDVALAIDRIQNATNMEIRHVRRTWAGLRSFVADEVPVVGEDPSAPGFFWLAGQGGSGIMTSPAMARTVAGLITEGRLPQELANVGVDERLLSAERLPGRG